MWIIIWRAFEVWFDAMCSCLWLRAQVVLSSVVVVVVRICMIDVHDRLSF